MLLRVNTQSLDKVGKQKYMIRYQIRLFVFIIRERLDDTYRYWTRRAILTLYADKSQVTVQKYTRNSYLFI